jgi:7-carboxy-7-deazaguanine synthase
MRALNLQPAEKPLHNTTGDLEVHSVFDTIQGEGPFAGTPAVFVRLAACNIQCPSCDTDYTSKRETLSAAALVSRVASAQEWKRKLVVITGGEPLRQPLWLFVRMLLTGGFKVQIETNGTLWQDSVPFGREGLSVVCSPKTPSLNGALLPHIDAYKYVLHHAHVDHDGLPTMTLNNARPARPPAGFSGDVFVQPEDSVDMIDNMKNLDAAKASCVRHGYRLSLQLHKMLGLA